MHFLEVSCRVVSGVTGERREFAAWCKKGSLETFAKHLVRTRTSHFAVY